MGKSYILRIYTLLQNFGNDFEIKYHDDMNAYNQPIESYIFRGNPPPTLYWTVDGLVVQNSHKAKISNKK